MIAALAAVGMGVLSSVAALGQGQAEQNIANQNAATSLGNAAQARYAARQDAAMIRLRSAYVVGSNRATTGATGIYVNSGTSADFTKAVHDQFEMDAIKELYEGNLQASAFEREAQIDQFTGRVARRNSYFQAGFGLFNNALGTYNALQYAKTPQASVMGPSYAPYSPSGQVAPIPQPRGRE